MSDHSTGSSGSSTSWTILSPEEAAVETLGPDDGTESLSGVPGLPEEGTAGVPMESEVTEAIAPAESVLSEEGHQVCQETAPEVCEAAAFSSPSFSGFEEGEFDPEIHAPVIHDTITSSPPDSDLLGSTPFSITSESALLFSEEPAFVPPASGTFTDVDVDVGFGHEIPAEELTSQVVSEEKSRSPEAIPEPAHTPPAVSQQSPAPEVLTTESRAASDVTAAASEAETLIPEISVPEMPSEPSPSPDTSPSGAPATETVTPESPVSEPQPTQRSPTPETLPEELIPDVSSVPPDTPTPAPALAPVPVEEAVEDLGQPTQSHPPSGFSSPPEARSAEGGLGPVSLEPETIASASAQPHEEEDEEEYEEEPALERGEADLVEKQDVEPVEAVPIEEEVVRAEPGAEGDGLRQRHALPPEQPLGRSSEDEDEEEEEFQLAERREEKQGFGLNKLIVGALVLLCLGSLFFSDDSLDGSEITEQELLDRLAQENQQIAMLEAQLQSQKEALDQAVRAAVDQGEAGGGALQKENVRLKEELAAMPSLKDELESLRARVAELSQLTVRESESTPSAADTVPPPADQPESESANQIPSPVEQEAGEEDGLKVELERQKNLLEDSRKRLEVMKRSSGKKKGVREGLVEMQKRLSEQAERLDKRHDWKRKQQQKESEAKKDQGKKWAGKKEQGNQWSGKKEHSGQWEDKSHKHSGQWESKKEHNGHKNGRKEHGDKQEGMKDHGKHKHREESEKWREQKEGKHGKDGKDGKDGKESKQHAWRKYHEDWDGRKHERKMEREKRKSERPWEAKSFKKSSSSSSSHHEHNHHHQQHHHHHQKDHSSSERSSGEHQHTHVDFWKHQEQKLHRNPGPAQACSGVAHCAKAEGLVPVELSEFHALLESYLGKLPASTDEGKEELQRLTSDFFPDGVFDHERLLFSDFAEDVADILEDLADVLDNDSLEEEMEEFEREALWKFGAAA